MKIAQVVPIIERVPPKMYGGTERVAHALTEELIKRGHEVTLFASGDSITSATLRSVYPRSLREAHFPNLYGHNYLTLLNVGDAYSMQGEFDIIHDHMTPISLPTANIATTPVVVTMHGAFNYENRRLFQRLNKPHLVTISKAQLPEPKGINHAGVVYNGLALEAYPFSNESDGYLLYVGRLSMEKGVHHAIAVARELDMRLIIAAKLDTVDEDYFAHYIKPRLTSRIEWIGEVDEAKRNELMSRARCFLHPVTWREPFGLTLIEAGACGCPVVAFNRGSIPEIIEDGVTGYVVNDLEEMTIAVESIDSIDRHKCRERALEHFSAERMTYNYEEIYKKILTGGDK